MFRYMKLAFRKDVYYQSFSQNTKVTFNNAFVRRCKKSCIFSLLGIYIVQNTKRHHQSLLQISERQFVVLMKACILRIRRCYKSLWNKGRTSIQGQAMYVRSAKQAAQTHEYSGCFAPLRSVQGAATLASLSGYPCGLAIYERFNKPFADSKYD